MLTSFYNEAGNLLMQIITNPKYLKQFRSLKNKNKKQRLQKYIKADFIRKTGLLYALLYELS